MSTFSNIHRFPLCVTLASMTLGAAACDDDSEAGEGMLRVTAYGEEFVEDKIPADAFVDGWEVDFSVLLVAIDKVSADDTALQGSWIFDLIRSSGGDGHLLDVMSVPAGVVEHLDYRVGPVSATDGGNASDDQVAMMMSMGYGVYVEGTATKAGETKTFAWGFTNATSYADCHTEQTVEADGDATSQITIHADHFFYDDLDSDEPNVAFDLIAAADADGNGEVTPEELRALDITGETRYQVGSRDITDLWGFIEAQVSTLGHIDGEGHCEVE